MDYLFRKYQITIEKLRLIPDLKLRTFVGIISICAIFSSFFVGVVVGQSRFAFKDIVITGAFQHEPWSKEVLDLAKGNIAAVGSSGEKNYVASEGGKMYYPKECKAGLRIKEEHRIWFATPMLAEASGYAKAKNCKWE